MVVNHSKSVSFRLRPRLKKFTIAYILLCLGFYFFQQRLLFYPAKKLANTPDLYQLDHQTLNIPIPETSATLNGWWIPADQPDAPTLLYFHHNAINIGANVSQALQFQELGYNVFLFDYRGYGNSSGPFPTESRVYEDAQAAWTYLTQTRNIPPQEIIIYGHSIGGAVATDLAAKQPEATALIVQSSFTSIKDMTKRLGLYWVLPVEWMLKQKFESLAKMPQVDMPVLIINGTHDIQIPVSMGERLFEAAAGPKEMIVIEGGSHDNHMDDPYLQRLQAFVTEAMQ